MSKIKTNILLLLSRNCVVEHCFVEPQYPREKVSGTIILFEKCHIRCVGNICHQAIFHLKSFTWRCSDIYVGKVTWGWRINLNIICCNFRPLWHKGRSLLWPLIKVNGVMLTMLVTPKIFICLPYFSESWLTLLLTIKTQLLTSNVGT